MHGDSVEFSKEWDTVTSQADRRGPYNHGNEEPTNFSPRY